MDHILGEVEPEHPRLKVRVDVGRSQPGRLEGVGAEAAEIALLDGGWLSLRRDGAARFRMPRAVAPEEIAHPWMVPAAATLNGWFGRGVLHGGVVGAAGQALAVIGAKEAGKSSLLAWLTRDSRLEVLADDLVVVDGTTVFAGPRCIDLRPGGVAAVAPEGHQHLVRDATRTRLALAPCSPSAQLVGVVVLNWSEGADVELQRLGPRQAVTTLTPHALGHRGLGSGMNLLDLLSFPAYALTRPRSWERMPEVADVLTALIVD